MKKGKLFSALLKYPGYIRDMRKYSRMDGAEKTKFADSHPCLFDRTAKTSVDSHYFYQHIWAFEKIHSMKPKLHVDVGSNANFDGSILELPYRDNSLESISCLHIAEHIGLGRYGDLLEPLGTKKAAAGLTRCLAKGGNLFFLFLLVSQDCI